MLNVSTNVTPEKVARIVLIEEKGQVDQDLPREGKNHNKLLFVTAESVQSSLLASYP